MILFHMRILTKNSFFIHFDLILSWISYTGGLFFLHLHLLVLHSFFPHCSTIHSETRSGGLRLSLRQKESKHPVYLSQQEAVWRKSRHKEVEKCYFEEGSSHKLQTWRGKQQQYFPCIEFIWVSHPNRFVHYDRWPILNKLCIFSCYVCNILFP